jgi:hypothetical protein
MSFGAPIDLAFRDEPAGSNPLARCEYLESVAISLDHIIATACDARSEEVVSVLAEAASKLRDLSESALAEHFRR